MKIEDPENFMATKQNSANNILSHVLSLMRYAEHLRPGTNPGRRARDGFGRHQTRLEWVGGWDLRMVSFAGF